ncbi:Type 1 glutamine amidotransferase-like domain-containing protein, partial [Burkholderia multivorans]|uniref:Type 1 glutamine amidotransferase-like domain-containing protein n=1 Tax=Burkholderia multivorans TaxID=87883 RepID=UPI001C66084D
MDLVYVGGGSTVNLLALWRTHGVDDVLRRAAATGTILAGISAGANCWFETSSTDSFGPLAPLRDGFGFLPGSACPHHHGEEGRAETFRTWIADGTLSDPGFGLDDGGRNRRDLR